MRVNANLSDHLAEIFSIIFKDPQHSVRFLRHAVIVNLQKRMEGSNLFFTNRRTYRSA